MSRKTSRASILSAFPYALAEDENIFALAELTADELLRICEDNEKLKIYTDIYKLGEELLDILARDFKVDWYLYDGDLESKRAQIESSFYVHRHLGTKGALLWALSDTFPGTNIEEWFEYDGRAGYFRIRSTNPQITADVESLLDLIGKVKRASALLESVELSLTSDGGVTYSVACEMSGKIDIYPRATHEITAIGEVGVSSALAYNAKIDIYPRTSREITAESIASVAGAPVCNAKLEIYPQGGESQ